MLKHVTRLRIFLVASSAVMAAALPLEMRAAAYPPSCFADGLPLGKSALDPHRQTLPLTLHGDFNACFVNTASPTYAVAQAECIYSETVVVTTWRVACSNGAAASVLEIDRAANLQGNTDAYPTFPSVFAQQDSHVAYLRLAQDPNTQVTQTFVNSPVYSNSIYVLDNFASGYVPIDFSRPFNLYVNANTGHALEFDVSAYSALDYAAAAQALPISGYLSGSWYDPTHSGEGILTQVFDNGDGATRTFAAAWYTYDNFGAPYWLTAQTSFAIGTTHLDNIPVQDTTGGGLAGSFSAVVRNSWGTLSVAFPNCSTLDFSFASAAATPIGNAPTGAGSRQWVRIGNLANLGCQ